MILYYNPIDGLRWIHRHLENDDISNGTEVCIKNDQYSIQTRNQKSNFEPEELFEITFGEDERNRLFVVMYSM